MKDIEESLEIMIYFLLLFDREYFSPLFPIHKKGNISFLHL